MSKPSLETFLAQCPIETPSLDDSQWVTFKDAELYIRFTSRRLPIGKALVFEVSNLGRRSRAENIEYDIHARNTGFMDEMMCKIEKRAIAVCDGVMIAGVMNEFLPGWFVRRGYSRVDDSFLGMGYPAFYRMNPVRYITCSGMTIESLGDLVVHYDLATKNPSCVSCETDPMYKKCQIQNTSMSVYHIWHCDRTCDRFPSVNPQELRSRWTHNLTHSNETPGCSFCEKKDEVAFNAGA